MSDDIFDAAVYIMTSLMPKRSYIVFNDDGTFIESKTFPNIISLSQYMRASNADAWWDVQLQTGMNIPTWHPCNPEDVPSGIRLLALLIT